MGFEPEEEAALKAESQRIICETLAVKEHLRRELTGWIEAGNLEKKEVVALLGLNPQWVSDVAVKKDVSVSIDALVDMLIRVWKRVQYRFGDA